MGLYDWIEFYDAAKRLGISAAELDRQIMVRKIRTSRDAEGERALNPEDVEAYKELLDYDRGGGEEAEDGEGEGDEEECRLQIAKCKLQDGEAGEGGKKRRGAREGRGSDGSKETPKMEWIRRAIADGVRRVTTATAAEMLGVGKPRVRALIRDGRLNAEKEGRTRWIAIDEVMMYRMDQEYYDRMGGRWSPYGRLAKRDPTGQMESPPRRRPLPGPLPRPLPGTERGEWGGASEGDVEISMREAAGILGISEGATWKAVAGAGLTRLAPTERRAGLRGCRIALSLREVMALADRRERKEWARSTPPGAWEKGTTRKPVVRTAIEAPPGDRLISRTEAAGILGVVPSRVSGLVTKGMLFGWQQMPGRRRCPLWLSERQVWRYACDEDRLKRREAALAPHPPAPSPRTTGEGESEWPEQTEGEIWMEEVGLTAALERARRPNLERDYGEYFTTKQAAKALGISWRSMDGMRRRGRLTGFQRPARTGHGCGRRWWFYLKEDVYALLADGEYLRARDAGKRRFCWEMD